MRIYTVKVEKLSLIEDRGQPDRVTTPTRAGLRRCCWPWPHRAARFAVQLTTWQQRRTITAFNQKSTLTPIETGDLWYWLSILCELGQWARPNIHKLKFKGQSV